MGLIVKCFLFLSIYYYYFFFVIYSSFAIIYLIKQLNTKKVIVTHTYEDFNEETLTER